MKEILLALASWFVATCLSAQTDVTAAQVNGTWKLRNNEFKIWALGRQRLQIEFLGTYEYKSAHGPTANTGEGSGIARIEGDTANFKPDGAEDECQIILRFTGGHLVVNQTGICGFGFNVSAEGTYKKRLKGKAEFRIRVTSDL